MKNNEKLQIKTKVAEKISKKELSQNRAAKEIGISNATLSQILNEKWELISNEMWRKTANWVNHRSDQWRLVQTRNLNAILSLCDDAKQNHRFLAVSGFTGSGKTTALMLYVEKTPNTYYMLCTNTMGRKDFLNAIQKSLGIKVEGSIHNRLHTVINFLAKQQDPLLIMDDFGKLTDANMRMVQIIYDELKDRAGIVISGTQHLFRYVDKMAAKDKLGFQELRRRIGFWQPMYRPTKSIVSRICRDYGIEDNNAVEFIYREAKDYGSMCELITNAMRAVNGSPVDVELLGRLSCGDKHFDVS